VFCTGDIIAGFEAVMRTLTSPDAPIIVPTPAYHLLLKTPRYFNRRVIEVPCTVNESGRYLLDYEAIDAVLQPGALFVLTNPYNPVGQAFLEDELRRLAALVSAHDALVFADEVHSPLILSETVAHIPYASISEQTAEHTVTAISASKAFNITGLKAAQLIICGEALKAKWKPYAPFYADAASRLGLAAAVAAYTDSRSLIWLEQIIATLQSNHRFLRQHFAHNHPEVTISSNDATYLAWIDVRPLHLGQRPAEFFLKHASVAVNDGTSFGAPGFIRLNFALEPDKLKRVCSQMTRALKMREAMSASLQSIRHVDAGKLLDCVGL
jgi:cystathionine beta-lyase